MPWIFAQRGGELLDPKENLLGRGYSGYDDGDGIREPGEGKGDPTAQEQRSIGPIPRGKYLIGPPFFHETKGPVVMRLMPMPGTNTFGRSGFLIHGDSARAPGTASLGCIVLRRELRLEVARRLEESNVIEVVEKWPRDEGWRDAGAGAPDTQ